MNEIKKENIKKIIIAGGGTGGHIFPAIAIANALKLLQPNTEFLFVGANGKMEMEKIPQAGYKIKGIDIAGFNRSALLKNIGLPIKLIKSFFQVKNIFKEFTPDAVIGVGGYSTFPVLKYAQSKKIPTFILESNSFAGKANQMLGKKATKIFVASAKMDKFFDKSKIIETGNPVRKEIKESNIGKEEALTFFNLQQNKKTILSVGGSLGAKSINETIKDNIKVFEENNLQLIWQTGNDFTQRAMNASADYKNVYTSAFIKEMNYAYAAADIIISRAGAMAIAELCIVDKPTIFIPYPFAAEDHQTINAQHLVYNKAAIMIKDSDVKNKLINEIIALVNDESHQQFLTKNMAMLATNNADEIIAKEIFNSIK